MSCDLSSDAIPTRKLEPIHFTDHSKSFADCVDITFEARVLG